MKKRKSRIKIISNKVFHKLWAAANRDLSLSEYINMFTSSDGCKPVVDFKKSGLDYVEIIEMLKSIYELAQYSFRDILESAGKKKAQVSDIFCIPIRTIEEWYTGNNKCSSYVRLMLLKEFHLLNLGSKYIKLESEIVYMDTIPSIYAHHERKDNKIGKTLPTQKIVESESHSDDDIDRLCNEINERYKPQRSEEERAFFNKYGFYPNNNVTWR